MSPSVPVGAPVARAPERQHGPIVCCSDIVLSGALYVFLVWKPMQPDVWDGCGKGVVQQGRNGVLEIGNGRRRVLEHTCSRCIGICWS